MMYRFRSFLRTVGTRRKASTSRGTYETFTLLEEHSRGITLLAGLVIGVGGIVAFTVQSRDAVKMNEEKIQNNKELAKKDTENAKQLLNKEIEMAKQASELSALKNLLLFGQSEEYKSMRQSFASRDKEEVPTDNTK
mmetsp:Transcript_9239/g.13913  ORF Transcript_9239/g.13913 Transcript_9239/m.13913 type:complete len:137 (+) Transcript_9239:82-492(+)